MCWFASQKTLCHLPSLAPCEVFPIMSTWWNRVLCVTPSCKHEAAPWKVKFRLNTNLWKAHHGDISERCSTWELLRFTTFHLEKDGVRALHSFNILYKFSLEVLLGIKVLWSDTVINGAAYDYIGIIRKKKLAFVMPPTTNRHRAILLTTSKKRQSSRWEGSIICKRWCGQHHVIWTGEPSGFTPPLRGSNTWTSWNLRFIFYFCRKKSHQVWGK